jgi:hypothetical protein
MLEENRNNTHSVLQPAPPEMRQTYFYNSIANPREPINGYSLQEAYQKIGGIGLFHYLASITLIFGFGSGMYVT